MIGCRTCTLLKAELDRAHAAKQQLLDRLLAVTAPHALAMTRPGAPTPNVAYDPETGYTTMIDGKEVPVVVREGVVKVPVGPGEEITVDEYRAREIEEVRRVRDMLDRMDRGEQPTPEEMA